MLKTCVWVQAAALSIVCTAPAAAAKYDVKGFSLTELGDFVYDASPTGGEKTEAQQRVDQLYALGVRHLNLHPRAVMRDPRGIEVIPVTPLSKRSAERMRYFRLMKYIHGKGMTVGIRPIFFVTDAQGNTPFVEVQPDGSKKTWWHGNIQPRDPNRWFDSFREYLTHYLTVARVGKADEFTIGAELYSMTVGIEDQWKEHPHGFPGRWREILQLARKRLPDGTRIMYDINFTDDSFEAEGIVEVGGELARWKYRLADLADENDEYWLDLKGFWDELDAVGIDMYRSLATDEQPIPDDHEELVAMLKITSDRYAGQIDNLLFEIQAAMGADEPKPVILKETGFRSAGKTFVRPFAYAGSDKLPVNIDHQAAAYRAVLESFYGAGFEWFGGIIFWDASVSPNLHGVRDVGFSPIGKKKTEDVVLRFFGDS
jgi:hypothetical protein